MIAQRNLREATPAARQAAAGAARAIDASAAAVILQSWLDARRPSDHDRVTLRRRGPPPSDGGRGARPTEPSDESETDRTERPPAMLHESADESARREFWRRKPPPEHLRAAGAWRGPPGRAAASPAPPLGWSSRSSRCWCSRSWSRPRGSSWQVYEPGDDGAPVSVTVQQGWGAKEIGDELASKDVVGSSLAFQLWYRVSGGSSQAGTYDLREHMGAKAATDVLGRAAPTRAAASADHTVLALPPGLRLEQIADRVGALPGHDRAAFLALAQSGRIRSKYQGDQTSVEGFTWPDTYFVEGMSDEQILQTIVSEFDEHGDAVGLGSTCRDRAHPAADGRRRVVGAGRGGLCRGRAQGRRRHHQPPEAGHAAPDRRHPLLREGRLPAGAEQRRQADRLALQHLPRSTGCRRRRS